MTYGSTFHKTVKGEEHADDTAGENRGEKKAEGSDFVCSLDGYVDLTKKAFQIAFGGVSLAKETLASTLPPDLSEVVKYLYDGMVEGVSWPGYLAAAGFYFGNEFGYGDQYCEAFGYASTVVEAVFPVINFAPGDGERDASEEEASEE